MLNNLKGVTVIGRITQITEPILYQETEEATGFRKHIYLRGTSNHVLDKVPVSRSINDGDIVLAGFKLPQGDIDGNTTLTLCLQLVQHPGILEGTLSHLYTQIIKYKNVADPF